jgi:hypothetical protein
MSENWAKISVRKELLERIEKFLKTKEARKLGYTNPTQFVDDVLRARLEEIPRHRFEHFNLHDDIIRVLDNEIGPHGDIIELRIRGNKLTCGFCQRFDCLHIKFAWSDPELAAELKKAGLRSPF